MLELKQNKNHYYYRKDNNKLGGRKLKRVRDKMIFRSCRGMCASQASHVPLLVLSSDIGPGAFHG